MRILIQQGLCVGVLMFALRGFGADTNECPKFQEVYDLVRANIVGVKESDLNRDAVQGFLSQLQSYVRLTETGTAESKPPVPIVSKTNFFDPAYGYVRIGDLHSGAGDKLAEVYQQLGGTNKLKGLILDLRFTRGQDYSAAAAVAGRFFSSERPLFSWGSQSAKSAPKENAITCPVIILVNGQTGGAAEVLAAVLRHYGTALLIGSPTAGQATVFKDFVLSNGQHLQIATDDVRLANGQVISAQGVTPDIRVAVSPEDEKVFYADAYKVLAKNAVAEREIDALSGGSTTNHTARHRLNEAELVRLQREGQSPDDEPSLLAPSEPPPGPPSIQDPVLARALDLLKGLALVPRAARSN